MSRVRPVILSGGSGTRLWPLSVDSRPKQFLGLVGETSLFAATLQRAKSVADGADVTIVTGASHVGLVSEAIGSSGATILIEPAPRNTAPAIVAAALAGDPDDILVILPSDHLIDDAGAFTAAARVAVDLAEAGKVVAFGCVPTRPEVGYGWIRPGAPIGGGFEIDEFVEKPGADRAAEMVASGYLWNSGMFVARSSVLAEEVSSGLLESVEAAVADLESGVLGSRFLDAPNISFDHEVMESTSRGVVVPLDAGWSDIGSWQAVWERGERDDAGNVIDGEVVAIDTTDSLVRSTSKPVAVVGLDGVVVVETHDGVLVMPRHRAQEVRDISSALQGDEPKA